MAANANRARPEDAPLRKRWRPGRGSGGRSHLWLAEGLGSLEPTFAAPGSFGVGSKVGQVAGSDPASLPGGPALRRSPARTTSPRAVMARMGFEDAPLAIALTQQLDLSREVLDAVATAASPDLALATLARHRREAIRP